MLETLRGLLLSAYAWSTVAMIAGIAGIAVIAAFIAAAVMAVLSVLGVFHYRKTPKSAFRACTSAGQARHEISDAHTNIS